MFESPRFIARTYTARLQAFVAVLATAWLATPDAHQAAVLAMLGANGEGAVAAAHLFAQVNIAIAAATVAARAYKQPALHQGDHSDERGPAA